MDANKIFEIKALLLNKQIELVKDQPTELRGRFRESLIQDFLEPLLPGKLGIDGGAIISSTDESSGEIDIIIYDKEQYEVFKPFAHFMPKKAKPIPVEVVYAIIEVEDKLNETALEKMSEKIKKVKKLNKNAYFSLPTEPALTSSFRLYGRELTNFPTLGIVFAYDSVNLEVLRNKLTEINSNIETEQQIDIICVLNKGLILYYNSKTDRLHFPFEPECTLEYRIDQPSENLKLFYLLFMRIMSQVWVRPLNVLEYFKNKK